MASLHPCVQSDTLSCEYSVEASAMSSKCGDHQSIYEVHSRRTFLEGRVLIRRPCAATYAREEDPVDIGLYWFGLHQQCKKWVPSEDRKTPTCEFFDPNKPSVIYVHGFARRTTARRFRETFNWKRHDPEFGLDINAADRWIEAGWNVGAFYWNHFADEVVPQDTECKIWTTNGRTGMRFRVVSSNGEVKYVRSPRASPSISQQFADILAQAFRDIPAPYRLVGHSLGHQVVVHATTLLREMMEQGVDHIQLPARIALLDPFGTLGAKKYCNGWPIDLVVQRELMVLKNAGIILEQYQTSFIGRRGHVYLDLTACIQLDPSHIPWYKLKSRHIAAIYMYFLSFDDRLRQINLRGKVISIGSTAEQLGQEARPVLGSEAANLLMSNALMYKAATQIVQPQHVEHISRNEVWAMTRWLGYTEVEADSFPALARATDEQVRELMESGFVYKQWNGQLFLRVLKTRQARYRERQRVQDSRVRCTR